MLKTTVSQAAYSVSKEGTVMQQSPARRTSLLASSEEWEITTLGEIGDIKNGATPNTRVLSNWNGTIPWCTPTDITNTSGKYFHRPERYITSSGLASCAASLLPVGTLLLCSRASVGEIKIATIPMCTNQGFKSIICKDDVFNEFIYYLLLILKPQIIKRAAGSTFLEISKRDLASVEIKLPTIDEQAAIAGALSDADRLLEALEALIAKKQAIKQAAMQQLLTGKIRLPGFSGEWKTKRLDEIGFFSKGRGIKREDILEDGHPCIRYGELYTQYHNYINTPVSHISAAVASDALPIKTNDILFAGSGETVDEIGRCAAYLGDTQAFAGADIVVFTPLGQNSTFLSHLINHPLIAKQKSRLGQGDAVVHISAQNLGQLEVCLPRHDEQTAIATVLSDMDTEITALERRRDKTRTIKQGMMQQLLTGRTRLVKAGVKS